MASILEGKVLEGKALEGKRLVVTGGAGVLGEAVARVACRHGAEVVLLDVVPDFESDLGPSYTVDLTDRDQVRACIEKIGRFNGLANIAGGFDMGPSVYETSDEMWQSLFDINVTTLRCMLSESMPVLLAASPASVVNVGAYGALKGAANMGAYTAAKSTVMRITEALSEEVRQAGVNVNAVLPSILDTPRNRDDMPDADHEKWVTPDDLAEVVCFLSSGAARAVHGALIPVVGLS